MATAKLFLDVDGVINSFGTHSNAWADWKTVKASANGIMWPIKFSPTMIEELKSLDLDLVWTTSWMEFAPTNLASAIGYGHNAWYLEPVDGVWDYPTIIWKKDAVRAYMEKNITDKFVWLDDELRQEDIEWAEALGGLAVQTLEEHGITRHTLARIQEYLAE